MYIVNEIIICLRSYDISWVYKPHVQKGSRFIAVCLEILLLYATLAFLRKLCTEKNLYGSHGGEEIPFGMCFYHTHKERNQEDQKKIWKKTIRTTNFKYIYCATMYVCKTCIFSSPLLALSSDCFR